MDKLFCNYFSKLLLIILTLIFICSSLSYANDSKNVLARRELSRHIVFDTVPMNLKEITDSADKIFSGICKEIEEIENDPVSHLQVTKYTFHVLTKIKGNIEVNSEISFKQWKPTTKDVGYKAGEKYIVFLYPNSNMGLTSPVGYLQGHFLVERSGLNNENEYVKNKLNNVGLSRNLKTQEKLSIKKDRILNNYIDNCSNEGNLIRYQDFIEAVKILMEN